MSSPFHYKDFYKSDHRRQYADGTTNIMANFTPRNSRIQGIDRVIAFGPQFFAKKYLIEEYNTKFFNQPKSKVVAKYKRRLDHALGKDAVPMDHVEALHELQYLPLIIKALPEGNLVPIQVPIFTVENTLPDFFWLTNDIETIASATIWGPCTSATTAFQYRRNFEQFAEYTGSPKEFVGWQGHDFSFRGMFGLEAAMMSGAGHLLSFFGTDTIPAIDFLEEWYNANCETELIGGSVPATEHSVMCSGGKETESDTYVRLLTKVYPKGIISIVSDTWDFWRVIVEILPSIKDIIMMRDGKLVIRPDSGDPVKIIVGDPEEPAGTPANKGLVQLLWEIFGGTQTTKGFKVLDSHIGAIYGDSITIARQLAILSGLAKKGFASSNIVLGIGSYTYQYTTRDVFGFAMKSTHCEINGVSTPIFKQPKTDSTKNSHKGLIKVEGENGNYRAIYPVTREEEQSENNQLKTIFKDGKMVKETSLTEIRQRINDSLNVKLTTNVS